MIEPDSKFLKSLAGWAISKRALASSLQELVLSKFVDATGELADVVDEIPGKKRQPTVEKPSPVADKKADDKEGCKHKFHIRTQCCIYCGLTYLKAMGAAPTYLGK